MRFQPVSKTIILFTLTSLLIFGCSGQEETPPATANIDTAETASQDDQATPAAETSQSPVESETVETESDPAQNAQTETTAESKPASTTPESDSSSAADSSSTAKTSDDHKTQLALARKSGCLACHNVDKKVIGPAWRDVAKRYKDVPDAKTKLINKVSKGGRGNWTDVVGNAAMPPYSPRVSDGDIALLVEFVLSLEK